MRSRPNPAERVEHTKDHGLRRGSGRSNTESTHYSIDDLRTRMSSFSNSFVGAQSRRDEHVGNIKMEFAHWYHFSCQKQTAVLLPKGNAVKDICSRIRQNLDFFELDLNSGEFGYVDHPVFSSVQNTLRRCPKGRWTMRPSCFSSLLTALLIPR